MPVDKTYAKKVYDSLRDDVEGFDKDEATFYKLIETDKNYLKNVHLTLKDVYGDDFDKDESMFESALGLKKKEPSNNFYEVTSEAIGLKPKQLSQSPLKTAETTTPSVSTKSTEIKLQPLNIEQIKAATTKSTADIGKPDVPKQVIQKIDITAEKGSRADLSIKRDKYTLGLEEASKRFEALSPQYEELKTQLDEVQSLYDQAPTPELQSQYNSLISQLNPISDEINRNITTAKTLDAGLRSISQLEEINREKNFGFGSKVSAAVGSTVNNLVNSTGKIIDTFGDLNYEFNELIGAGALNEKDFNDKATDRIATSIDEYYKRVNESIDKKIPESYSKYSPISDKPEADKLLYFGLNSIAQLAPTVAATLTTGGLGALATGFAMEYGGMYDTFHAPIKQKYIDQGLSEAEAEKKADLEAGLMAIGGSTVVGQLDRFGAVDMLNAVTKKALAKKITQDALVELGEKTGKEAAEQAIKKSITKNLVDFTKGYGKAVATETLTEPVQELVAPAITDVYNAATGEDTFKEGGLGDIETWKNAGNAGIGAFLASSPAGTISGVQRVTSQGYNTAMSITNEAEKEKFVAILNDEVEAGLTTPEQAEEAIKASEKIQEVDALIPNSIEVPQQRLSAVNLLMEKQELSEQIEGKDKALSAPQIERIKAIDEELSRLASTKETTTEEKDGEGTIEGAVSAGTNVAQEGLGVANEPSGEGVTGEGVQAETVPQAPTPIEVSPQAKQEVSDIKSGTLKTSAPIRLFKGLFGKRNADGTRRSAHPDVKGVFSAIEKDVAERYKGEEDILEYDIPEGTTIEVIKLENKKVPLSVARAQETELINNSTAQVVKLITIDAKGAEEQYIIKDPSILSPKSVTEKTESTKPLAEQIADLRAEEQSEYDAIDPKDTVGREKIYNNYDKLITPLLEEQKAAKETKPAEKVEEAQTAQVSQSIGTSPKNLKDLYNVNKDIFGLNRVQAFASAVAMDRMVGAMAKRAGVTKSAMYGRIDFKKDTQENILKADNALFQGVVNGENVTLRNLDVDVVNGFYSPLEKIIAESKQDKMPAKQWIDKFAKGEEAKWTGLTDWLSQQEGSVSKKDILNYLKDNRINIVEVVKGSDKKIKELLNRRNDLLIIVGDYERKIDEELSKGVDKADVSILNDLVKSKVQAQKDFAVADRLYNNAAQKDNTKFSQYQLEGEKENYKEVLVTLPNQKDNSVKIVKSGDGYVIEKGGQAISPLFYTKEQAENNIGNYINNEGTFKSSHFDEPNILVHLRMNTRTDAEGKKVLFLEEVQSDWGQKGKKEGFKGDKSEQELKSELERLKQSRVTLGNDNAYLTYQKEILNPIAQKLYGKNYSGNLDYNQRQEVEFQVYSKDKELWRKIENADKDLRKQLNDIDAKETEIENKIQETPYAVPSAPFVMDTNDWVKLGLKVALKEAIAQGADKIAWTTGEQQNERYDLSKQVDRVTWEYEKGLSKDIGTVTMYKDGKEVGGETIPVSKLPDVIGKDLANKILEQEEKQSDFNKYYNQKELKGEGLKVGGKGMKGFYGSPTEGSLGIVGNVAKNLFKQEPKVTDFGGEVEIVDNKILKNGNEVGSIKKSKFEGDFIVENDETGERFAVKSEKEATDIFQKGLSIQHSIDVTPALRAEVEKGLALFQKEQGVAKGAMVAADGRFIIYAITDPNISTPLHELAHVFEHYLTESESKAIIKSAGTKGWTTETSEYFARGFEKYLAEGKSPIPGLEKLFAKFKEWLTEIYNGIVGSDIDIKLNKPMRDIYAAMLGKEPASKTAAKPAKSERKAISNAKIDDLAAKAKEFLRNKNLPEGTQVSGISQNKVIDLMASTVKALVNSGIEIAEAIKQVREFFEQDFDTSAVKDYQIAQAIARDELTDVAKDNGFSSYREAVFAVNKYVREVSKEDVITKEEIEKAKEAKDKEAEAPKKGYKPKKKQAQEAEKGPTIKETGRSKSYAEGRVPVSEAYNDVVNAQKEYYEQMNQKATLEQAEEYLAQYGDSEQGLIDAYDDMMKAFRANPFLDARNAIAIELLADRMFARALDFQKAGQSDKYNRFLEKSEDLRKEAFKAHYKAGQFNSAVAVFSRSVNPDAFLAFIDGQAKEGLENFKKTKPNVYEKYEQEVKDFQGKVKDIKKAAAQQAVVSAPNSTTKVNIKVSDKLKARYEQGKARQAEALKKLGKINFFGSSGLSNEAIEAVGELVLSQFEQGIYKAATIIERIIEITEGKLTEKNIKDVYDAYKVNYKGEKLTLTELEEVLRKEEIAEKEPATDIDKALEKEREKLAKIKADYEQAVVDKADALVLKRAQQFVKDQEKRIKDIEAQAKKAATAKTSAGKRPTISDLLQRDLEADLTKEAIAKNLMTEGGLSEREANKLAEIYYNKYRKILKEKIQAQLLKDLTPRKVKEIEAQMNALDGKPFGKTLGGMIANQVAAGALDSESLRAAFASKYDIPSVSPIVAANIRALSAKVRAAKTTLGVNLANKNLLTYINSTVKTKKGSIISTLYYTSILSGISTAVVNTYGNVNNLINQATENFVQSIIEAKQGNKGNLASNAQVTAKIRKAVSNLVESFTSFIDIMAYGGGESRYSTMKKGTFGSFESEDLILKKKDLKDLGFKKAFTALAKLYKTAPAFFVRNLPASDEGFYMANFNMEATRELRKKLYSEGLRGEELEKKVYEQVYGTKDIKAQAINEAIQELKRIGINPSSRKLLVNRIAKEIILKKLDETVQNAANELAKENTFRGQPRGATGYLSQKIPQLWLVTPFVSTPFKMAEKMINYIPLYGAIRYYGGGITDTLRKISSVDAEFKRKGIEYAKKEGELRNKQLAQVLTGHLLALAFWGLSQIDWEDEDGKVVPFVDASAGYYGIEDKADREKLREALPEYTMRIGNLKFSYKTNPLLAMIALPFGVIKDSERAYEEMDFVDWGVVYNNEILTFLYESTPIKGLQEFFKNIGETFDIEGDDRTWEDFAQIPVKQAAALGANLAIDNLYKQMFDFYDPTKYVVQDNKEVLYKAFNMENIGGLQTDYDRWGREIKFYPGEAFFPIQYMFKDKTDKEITDWEIKNDITIPKTNRKTLVLNDRKLKTEKAIEKEKEELRKDYGIESDEYKLFEETLNADFKLLTYSEYQAYDKTVRSEIFNIIKTNFDNVTEEYKKLYKESVNDQQRDADIKPISKLSRPDAKKLVEILFETKRRDYINKNFTKIEQK